jgi:hypothetical protein
MIIKCNCNNCSTHLEFEAGNEGVIIACPSCGLDTRLYAPPPPPAPVLPPKEKLPLNQSVADPRKTVEASAPNALRQVRDSSCYKNLRGFITLVQAIWIFFSCLIIAGGFIPVLLGAWTVENIVYLVLSVLVGAAGIVFSFVMREASLLFVDIADCQIQLVKRIK